MGFAWQQISAHVVQTGLALHVRLSYHFLLASFITTVLIYQVQTPSVIVILRFRLLLQHVLWVMVRTRGQQITIIPFYRSIYQLNTAMSLTYLRVTFLLMYTCKWIIRVY
jgi:hypothetical protein